MSKKQNSPHEQQIVVFNGKPNNMFKSKQSKKSRKSAQKRRQPNVIYQYNPRASTQKAIRAPVAQSSAMVSRRPQGFAKVHNVKHCELIFTLSTPATTVDWNVIKRLRCNPASKATFNWLSSIAVNYEMFKFNKLRFISHPRCATSQPGSIIISPDYDSADTAPPTEMGMSANVDTVEDAPWKTIICELPAERLNKAYKAHFCMTDSRFVNTAQDAKTIDPAQVSVATVYGVNAVVPLSKVWVEYDVDFMSPQFPTEPLNESGQVRDMVASITAPTTPFTAIAVNVFDDPPIMAEEAFTFPTAKIGTFIRDWSGIWNSTATGTGITSFPTGLLNGVSLGLTDNLFYANAAGTQASKSYVVGAKKGDVLSTGSWAGLATTISQVNNVLAATNVV